MKRLHCPHRPVVRQHLVRLSPSREEQHTGRASSLQWRRVSAHHDASSTAQQSQQGQHYWYGVHTRQRIERQTCYHLIRSVSSQRRLALHDMHHSTEGARPAEIRRGTGHGLLQEPFCMPPLELLAAARLPAAPVLPAVGHRCLLRSSRRCCRLQVGCLLQCCHVLPAAVPRSPVRGHRHRLVGRSLRGRRRLLRGCRRLLPDLEPNRMCARSSIWDAETARQNSDTPHTTKSCTNNACSIG